MISKRQEGSDITIMDTIHFREKIDEDGKIKFIEHLDIVYKDNQTGEKGVQEIINPDYIYYQLKQDKIKPYSQFFVPTDDVEERVTPNTQLLLDIAKHTGNEEFFYNNIRNGNSKENNRLHCHPSILGSDINIEDHYRFRFNNLYTNTPCPITKSFLDIETDTQDINYEFPDMETANCPINAISVIFQNENKIYSLLLRDPTNPLIQEFEQEVKSGSIFPELKEFIIDAVGGQEKAEKFDLINTEINFLFYDADKEINLIIDLFRLINTWKPDFLLAWNMSFDMVYLINRIKTLGYDPAEIISHPDFKYKYCQYVVDNYTGIGNDKKFKDIAERGDNAIITSYTSYQDQMIHFASRRKGQGKFLSYGLDYIGEHVAKVKKLDYKSITPVLGKLPKINYKIFVFYNIMDTIVQKCIEYNTEDLEYVFMKAIKNNTRYNKIHRQTIYLANRFEKMAYENGFILGNNINKFNPKPTNKFPGAFVADPMLLNDYSKLRINNIPINVFNNLMDFDKRIVA